MKKIITCIAAIIFASLVFTGCGKSELEKDGERYGKLMCQYQKLQLSGNENDISKAADIYTEIQEIFDKYHIDKVGKEKNDKFREEYSAHMNDCD